MDHALVMGIPSGQHLLVVMPNSPVYFVLFALPIATTYWKTDPGTSTAWSAIPASWRPPIPRNVSAFCPSIRIVLIQYRCLVLHGVLDRGQSWHLNKLSTVKA